jgi:hypothetical protein
LQWQANAAPPEVSHRSKTEAALQAALPEEIAAEGMRLGRPAIGLWPQRSLASTASRLGGMPEVPKGFAWPMENGEPPLFLAAIHCNELSDLPGSDELPATGLLAFFADSDGVSRSTMGAAMSVIDLVPAAPQVAPSEILPLASIAFRPLFDQPDQWSAALSTLLDERDIRDCYASVMRALCNSARIETSSAAYGRHWSSSFASLLFLVPYFQWRALKKASQLAAIEQPGANLAFSATRRQQTTSWGSRASSGTPSPGPPGSSP